MAQRIALAIGVTKPILEKTDTELRKSKLKIEQENTGYTNDIHTATQEIAQLTSQKGELLRKLQPDTIEMIYNPNDYTDVKMALLKALAIDGRRTMSFQGYESIDTLLGFSVQKVDDRFLGKKKRAPGRISGQENPAYIPEEGKIVLRPLGGIMDILYKMGVKISSEQISKWEDVYVIELPSLNKTILVSDEKHIEKEANYERFKYPVYIIPEVLSRDVQRGTSIMGKKIKYDKKVYQGLGGYDFWKHTIEHFLKHTDLERFMDTIILDTDALQDKEMKPVVTKTLAFNYFDDPAEIIALIKENFAKPEDLTHASYELFAAKYNEDSLHIKKLSDTLMGNRSRFGMGRRGATTEGIRNFIWGSNGDQTTTNKVRNIVTYKESPEIAEELLHYYQTIVKPYNVYGYVQIAARNIGEMAKTLGKAMGSGSISKKLG